MTTVVEAKPSLGHSRVSASTVVMIAICSLAYFLDGLGHSILGPLAPDMAVSLSLSRAELGPVFSANLVGQCIGLVLIPLLGRRIGHQKIIVASLLGFGLFQITTGLASGRDSLIAMRLVTGFFLGGCLPSCIALVAEGVDKARRGVALSVLFTGYALGSALAGVLASLFPGPDGWRLAMTWVGGACLVAALAAWLWLPNRGSGSLARDHSSGVGSQGALAILSPRYRFGTLMLWLMFISMLTISYCLSSWLPVLMVDVGRDKELASVSVSVFGAGGIIATLGLGFLVDRFGTQRVLALFLSAATILLFLIGRLLESASPQLLMFLLAVGGFFCLGAYSGVNIVLANYYSDDLRAIGTGWTKSVGRVGTILAPILIGLGLSAGMAETTVMSLFALPALVATIALILIGRVGREPRPAASDQLQAEAIVR